MSMISPGVLGTPSIPLPGSQDSSNYSQKPTTSASNSGCSSVNYGQLGGNGTDLGNLSNTSNNAGSQSDPISQLSQAVAQLAQIVNQLIQSFLEKILGGQDKQSAGGCGSESGSPTPGAGGDVSGGGTPTPGANGDVSGGGTPTPGVSGNDTSSTTGGNSDFSGGSQMNLPAAMKPYEKDFAEAGKASGIPPQVLAGMMWQESRGDLSATTTNGGNGKADVGVMQINEDTFAAIKAAHPDKLPANADRSNPKDAIMAAALHMSDMKQKFGGNLGAALRAYNSGENNVNTSNLSDISKAGTGDATYVDKVMNFGKIIGSGNGSLPA